MMRIMATLYQHTSLPGHEGDCIACKWQATGRACSQSAVKDLQHSLTADLLLSEAGTTNMPYFPTPDCNSHQIVLYICHYLCRITQALLC